MHAIHSKYSISNSIVGLKSSHPKELAVLRGGQHLKDKKLRAEALMGICSLHNASLAYDEHHARL